MYDLRQIFRWTSGLSAVAALAVVSLGAPADTPENALPAKRMVRQVQVVVSGAPVDANRIRANMATREGGAFSDEIVERDIKNLYATGLIEKVGHQHEEMGGRAVVVKVTGRGVIGSSASSETRGSAPRHSRTRWISRSASR